MIVQPLFEWIAYRDHWQTTFL